MVRIVAASVEEMAEFLHQNYRAAFKALHSGRGSMMGVGRVRSRGTGCLNEHDHGWTKCHKKAYFLRRAKLIIQAQSSNCNMVVEEAGPTHVANRGEDAVRERYTRIAKAGPVPHS